MSPIGSARLSRAYHDAVNELRRNREQWKVYESTGNCVVLAGPGSGKTKVLTVKVARMLSEDVDAPRGVACITYNNECARELTRRLSTLGVREAHNVSIGTTHSFCLQQLLRPYARIAGVGLPDPFKVASTRQQALALQRAVDAILPYPEQESNYRARVFDGYRRTFWDRTDSAWAESDPHAPSVIQRYEEMLHEQGLIDFDDMVLVGLRLLKNYEWVRTAIRCRFPILVVDEYQDLGAPLDEIVRVLMGTGVRILAVGDPDQSIYGFAGANPKLLEQLASLDEVEDVRLKLNYRSRQRIVDGSLIVLREERDYRQASDEEEAEEGVIDFVECPEGQEQQAEVILDRLLPETLDRRKRRRIGDIAILYPNRHIGGIIARAAEDRGIPVIRIDQGASYRRTPFTRWLEDCASWCAGGWLVGEPALSAIAYRWLSFSLPRANDEFRWQETVRLVGLLWQNRQSGAPLATWLDTMYEGALEEILGSESEHQDELAAWEELRKACDAEGPLREWTVEMFAGQGGSPDHLNLMTLHSAKGLEFDVVVMMGMDQGVIPPWAAETEEAKREPRRLFYVGITRAKHEVYMTYSGFTVNQYGRRFDNGPSEFLLELQTALEELG